MLLLSCMTIQEKLKIIMQVLGLSQTQLAQKIGVSFVTINKWLNNKAIPRLKKEEIINDLYIEATGQKIIPDYFLLAKKSLIISRSQKHNVLKEILENPDIKELFFIKITYNSNKIEGSTLSEKETEMVFKDIALPNKTLIEQIEAKNHQTALIYVFSHILKQGKIDERFILKIHSILMNGIIEDAGSYRNHAVRIVGANVPTANYIKIPNLMNLLIKDINKKDNDIVALISNVHSRFEEIHPFSDGNGRTGRLIMQAMLLKSNLSPVIIRQEKKLFYYNYLNNSQLKGDSTQLQDFICDAILEGFDVLKKLK